MKILKRITLIITNAWTLLFLCLFQSLIHTSAFSVSQISSATGCLNQSTFSSRHIFRAPSTRLKATYLPKNDETGSASLEHFLSTCCACNKKQAGSVQILSRGAPGLPKHQSIETSIFITTNQDSVSFIVAITRDTDTVDEPKLQRIASGQLSLAPMDRIQSMFGFALGTIPPLGHLPTLPLTIFIEESLMEVCQAENQMLLGAAGHPYWQCLVSPEILLTLPNVQVASFSTDKVNAKEGENESTSTGPNPLLYVSCAASDAPKPFFSAETPPIHTAQILVEHKDLSNPLKPIQVNAFGRLGKLERKTKKLLTADLLPPFDKIEEAKEDPRPWRSASSGEDMDVHLIFGKALFQRFGATQGDAAIHNLKEGQMIEITAQTKVSNRDSLGRWVGERSLDLEVWDFRILSNESTDDGGASTMTSDSKPFKHKPVSGTVSPQLPVLTLRDVFGDSGQVEIVDTMESLHAFARDSLELLANLDIPNETTPATLMGMDCEWQPNQLSPLGEPQPILLLQISFHSLGKVYLLDLQTLLRPLLSPEAFMNELESVASETLDILFRSKRVVKVGYQIASDLRRIAASYPHVPCFQEIQAVLEVDTLVKRVLHLTKQKKSRSITMSLARLTAHYIQKSLSKECQVSNWSGRPLTQNQIEYASLDAAISPMIAEKALESINATIDGKFPRVERWHGDEGVAKAIDSWRFLYLQTEDEKAIKKLQAKQIVGPSWIVTQSWITGGKPPQFPSVPPPNGEGPYTDNNGVLRLPARMIQIQQPGDEAIFASMIGKEIGISKDRCLGLLLTGATALPEGARIDYPQRSSYVEFQDGVALFLTMSNNHRSGEPRNFPNEFLDDGKILSWFISSNDWRNGCSGLATKLLSSRKDGDDYAPLLLFVRSGKGSFVSGGRCRILLSEDVPSVTDTDKPKGWGLTQLNLELLDYETLAASEDFAYLISPLMLHD
jgi:prolyl-tRNA editing enzyme YbaK/EbsC (Cys-tRNA(Pro) deacylase)